MKMGQMSQRYGLVTTYVTRGTTFHARACDDHLKKKYIDVSSSIFKCQIPNRGIVDKQRARLCPCIGELDEGGCQIPTMPLQLPGRGVVGHLIDKRINGTLINVSRAYALRI